MRGLSVSIYAYAAMAVHTLNKFSNSDDEVGWNALPSFKGSVSDPYSSNPDLDPAKNLNPDPSYYLPLSEFFLSYLIIKIFSSKEVN